MNLFEKALYLGLGAISITREKADKLIEEMVQKGEVSRDEAKRTLEELLKKGEEQKDAIRSLIRSEMENWKKDIGVVTRSDLDRLEERIKELENNLS